MGVNNCWVCKVCGRPIRSRTGYVVITDAEHGGWPKRSSSVDLELTDDAIAKRRDIGLPTEKPFGTVRLGEVAFSALRIAFAAYHQKCDPNPEEDSYWFGVEDASTLESYMRWVIKLCDKKWMSTRDIQSMICFWFTNRSRKIPRT